MLIDCAGCVVRGLACGDCVVTVLLGSPSASGSAGAVGHSELDLDAVDRRALHVLADAGLAPRLRHERHERNTRAS
jgi:hypothetical protein